MATPIGRYARADEVAVQILFLLSASAATITGTVLTSDGGLRSDPAPIHRLTLRMLCSG